MISGELIVDNFAGGGGASTGIELATGYSVDIAINHDPEAIKMHRANHPNAKHYCEDVWKVDPVEACQGHPVALAWFSPDCKHFSKAKGGKPKDKNIRGLAWVACRWAGLVRPRVIMLENVEEFKTWGPLNRRHHPIKSKQGKTFEKFVQQLTNLGYEVQFRELVAADYGAPTMRKRFFLIARCDGKPIVWPEPSHAPADSEAVKNGLLKPYVGAYTQLDFSLPCPSIFDTSEEIKEKYGIRAKRPLAPKTMERIARGLKKFVINNAEPFIVQIGQTGFTADRSKDVRQPLTTIVSKNEHCLISPTLIQYHSETAKDEVRGQSIEEPIMTVDSSNRYGLVTSFLHKYYDGGYKGAGNSIENPLPTVTSWDHNSVVTANLIQMNNHCDGRDIRQPLQTITAGDGHFGEVRAFLIKYYGQGTGQDIKAPLDTVTAQDRFGLVTIEGVDYQIVDIGLRMLEPKELYGCQGFPDDYIIDHDYTGKTYPRSEQVRRCGNAVCPPIPAALVRANLPELCVAERTPNMKIETEQTGQLRFA
nr:MAG TPA: DNA cytosine methyltransferase [Caudoviricetes sp.]